MRGSPSVTITRAASLSSATMSSSFIQSVYVVYRWLQSMFPSSASNTFFPSLLPRGSFRILYYTLISMRRKFILGECWSQDWALNSGAMQVRITNGVTLAGGCCTVDWEPRIPINQLIGAAAQYFRLDLDAELSKGTSSSSNGSGNFIFPISTCKRKSNFALNDEEPEETHEASLLSHSSSVQFPGLYSNKNEMIDNINSRKAFAAGDTIYLRKKGKDEIIGLWR